MIKLHGPLNLSKIPHELITTNKAGDKVIWIDVVEKKVKGNYGDTHTITAYDKENRKTHYLADLTPQEFGVSAGQQAPASYRQQAVSVSAPIQSPATPDDLPF